MTSAVRPIRVLVADDHPVVREGLRLILETSPDFALVAEAVDGAQAVDLVRETQPDVALLDLRMPGVDGLEALRRIRAEQWDVEVIVLTNYNEDDLVLQSLQAGARGYLLKDAGRQTLLDALRTAARGETLLQPEVLARVLSHAVRPAAPQSAPDPSRDRVELTKREREVLMGAARGERNKEIAARLGITERTTKAYFESVYAKLGVDSRASAVTVALQRGLLPELGV